MSLLSLLRQRDGPHYHHLHCINKIVSIVLTKLSLLEYLAIITFLFIHFHIVIHLQRPPKEVYDVIYNSVSTLMSPNMTKPSILSEMKRIVNIFNIFTYSETLPFL